MFEGTDGIASDLSCGPHLAGGWLGHATMEEWPHDERGAPIYELPDTKFKFKSILATYTGKRHNDN